MSLLRKLQNMFATLSRTCVVVVRKLDSHLWSYLHRVNQGCKSFVTRLLMLVSFVRPAPVLTKIWAAVLSLDRGLWQFGGALMRVVVAVVKAPFVAAKYLGVLSLKGVNKLAGFMQQLMEGFIWMAKLPYNGMLFGGRVLSLSYAHMGNYVQNTMQRVKAAFARMWGALRIYSGNIKNTFLVLFILKSIKQAVLCVQNAMYGFIWTAKLPYNSLLFGGRVLSLSYAHMGNYMQNIIQKVRAAVARILGALRIYGDNVKNSMLNKDELSEKMREMWNVSNERVDICVKEAGSLLKPKDGEKIDIPESASLYVKNKSIMQMMLMRFYARMRLYNRLITEKFERIVKSISFEYHRIMTYSESKGQDVHSPLHRAINNRPNRAIMIMLLSMAGLFTAFILWASIVEIPRYVHARGRIETYDQLQVITAFNGAIVKQVMVEEDQPVSKGQELIRFDTTVLQAKYHDLQEKYYTKLGAILALEARISDSPLVLDAGIKAFSPLIYSEIQASYQAGINVNNTNLAVIDSQISHKEKEISDAKRDQVLYVQHLDLVKQQVEILTKLAANELVSRLRLLEVEKEKLNTEIKLKGVEASLLKSEASLKELNDRRANFLSNSHKDMLNELSIYRNELSSIIADMEAAKDQLDRAVIVSPTNGTVYKISNKAVVGHTVSGQEVISIVPSGGGLVMNGFVLPGEIGFIKKGQKVAIKVTTYDYSIYGTLNGTVERISPETIQNRADGIFYYEVVVKSEHNYLQHKGRKLYITPGMDATADFEMDKKTVLGYILDPFLKTMNESLSER